MWKKMLLEPGTEGASGSGTEGAGTGQTGASTKPTHKLVVKGQELFLTTEELVARAQKGINAEHETQKAVELQREMQGLQQFREDAQAAAQGDMDAFRRYAKVVGLPQEIVDATVQRHQTAKIREAVGSASTEESEDDDDGSQGGGLDVDQLVTKVAERLFPALEAKMKKMTVGFNNLDEPIRVNLAKLVGKTVEENLSTALDNDPYFGKFFKRGSVDQKKTMRSRIEGEVRRRVQSGQDLSDPTLVKELLQEMRSEYEALGIRPAGESTSFTGLGSSSGGFPNLHQSTTPMARPKEGMNSFAYDEYVSNKIASKLQEMIEQE